MKLAELRKLIARGEDSRLQFKADMNNADALAAEMVAFANSDGGQIAIGVGDDGKIVGLSRSSVERINQLISNAASQHVRSPIAPLTDNVVVGKGQVVIVATIPKGIDKPYFDKNGVIWLKKRVGQAAGQLQGGTAAPVPDLGSVPCR
jgi:ATP-dependent DNA helicase RecG